MQSMLSYSGRHGGLASLPNSQFLICTTEMTKSSTPTAGFLKSNTPDLWAQEPLWGIHLWTAGCLAASLSPLPITGERSIELKIPEITKKYEKQNQKKRRINIRNKGTKIFFLSALGAACMWQSLTLLKKSACLCQKYHTATEPTSLQWCSKARRQYQMTPEKQGNFGSPDSSCSFHTSAISRDTDTSVKFTGAATVWYGWLCDWDGDYLWGPYGWLCQGPISEAAALLPCSSELCLLRGPGLVSLMVTFLILFTRSGS